MKNCLRPKVPGRPDTRRPDHPVESLDPRGPQTGLHCQTLHPTVKPKPAPPPGQTPEPGPHPTARTHQTQSPRTPRPACHHGCQTGPSQCTIQCTVCPGPIKRPGHVPPRPDWDHPPQRTRSQRYHDSRETDTPHSSQAQSHPLRMQHASGVHPIQEREH